MQAAGTIGHARRAGVVPEAALLAPAHDAGGGVEAVGAAAAQHQRGDVLHRGQRPQQVGLAGRRPAAAHLHRRPPCPAEAAPPCTRCRPPRRSSGRRAPRRPRSPRRRLRLAVGAPVGAAPGDARLDDGRAAARAGVALVQVHAQQVLHRAALAERVAVAVDGRARGRPPRPAGDRGSPGAGAGSRRRRGCRPGAADGCGPGRAPRPRTCSRGRRPAPGSAAPP